MLFAQRCSKCFDCHIMYIMSWRWGLCLTQFNSPQCLAVRPSHKAWTRVIILEFSLSFASCNNLFKMLLIFVSDIFCTYVFLCISIILLKSMSCWFLNKNLLVVLLFLVFFLFVFAFLYPLIHSSVHLFDIVLVTFYLSGTVGDPSWYFLAYRIEK